MGSIPINYYFRHPEIDDVSTNFKSRFVSSLGEVEKFVREEKRKLSREEGGGEEAEEKEEETTELLGVRTKGTASGRYFRKCSNVLRAQVEVRM